MAKVKKTIDVPGASAPVVKLAAGDVVAIGDTNLRFMAPGRYIIVDFDRWTALLQRAVINEQTKIEESSRAVRRAQHRELIRDRTN
jgi:hypothetical protein